MTGNLKFEFSGSSNGPTIMLHSSRSLKRLQSFQACAGISYALLPEQTMNKVLEQRRKVQGAPKVYKDWTIHQDLPPDVHQVTFNNDKLRYYGYNPPEGYTAQEIMQFHHAKAFLTVEKAQALLDDIELVGTFEWDIEDVYPRSRDGPGPFDIKRKAEPVA
ncbi:hypothetical protein C8J56DRAFT_889052 [Mycena floridula]|nr:hypothetical protein C8J56DRAFT_889052 [Mycena floridula]